MKLQEAISKDIETMTKGDKFKPFLDEVDIIYQADFRTSNAAQVNPNDAPRQALHKEYAKRKKSIGADPVPDFYFKGTADETFESLTDEDSVLYGYQDTKVAGYMLGHEEGKTKGVGVARRQFPIESDMGSSRQQDNMRLVEQALTEHLNSDRTIIVNG